MSIEMDEGRDERPPWRMNSQHEQEPRERKTSDERTHRAPERRPGPGHATLVLALLGFFTWRLADYLPGVGGWLALALTILGVGLSVSRTLRRSGGRLSLASPVRGVFLVWLAICVAMVVLVSLDMFSLENIVILSIVWGMLVVLWVVDRGVARLVRPH
jgi:hypothetical protein